MPDYPFWPYPLNSGHPRNKLEARFWGVHALYPEIYERVDTLCRRLISLGRKRYAVDAFFNQLRWHQRDATMDPPESWKMNDHYRPYYARFWLQNNERHWGFFELRRVKGEYPMQEEGTVEIEFE